MSQTPRRSTRVAARTPSVAESVGSARTATRTAQAIGARRPGRPPRVSGQLPILSAQVSSAYGAKGSVSLAQNQPGQTSQFSQIFEEQRQTALERDETAPKTPSRQASVAPSMSQRSQMSEIEEDELESDEAESVDSDESIETERAHGLNGNVTGDVSKSYGLMHEGGLLGNIRLEPPRLPRPALIGPPRHVHLPPEPIDLYAEESIFPVQPSWTSITRRFVRRIPSCGKLIFLLICLLPVFWYISIGGYLHLGVDLSPYASRLFGTPLSEETASKVLNSAKELSSVHPRLEKLESEVTGWSRMQSALKSLFPRLTKVEKDVESQRVLLEATTKKVEEQYKNLPIANLEALANANVIKNSDFAIHNINWFSPSYGTVIIPRLTSPTQAKLHSWAAKAYSSILWLPGPKSPMAALEPWSEPGDCWCAAASKNGKAQLGVNMKYRVYPQSITVEHMPKEGVVDIGSAPRHMELWVQVHDADVRARLEQVRGDNFDECSKFPHKEFVCIGQFEYDINALNHIQTFKTQIYLEDYKTPVQRAVVRVTENWGKDWTCLYRVKLHGMQGEE